MIQMQTIRPDHAPDVLVVSLTGRLDSDSADSFFTQFDEEVAKGSHRLVLDCRNLAYISSLGFGMMIRAHSRVQSQGGGVKFAGLEGPILEAFQTVGFHRLFTNHPSVDAAIEAFRETT
ncbi:MAG: STAS domain-containing protein [Fuerstiella sp.]